MYRKPVSTSSKRVLGVNHEGERSECKSVRKSVFIVVFRASCKGLSTIKNGQDNILATTPGQAKNCGILVEFSSENLVYHRDQFKLRSTDSWSLLVYCASKFIENYQDLWQIILRLSSNFKDSSSSYYRRSLARNYIVLQWKKFMELCCL